MHQTKSMRMHPNSLETSRCRSSRDRRDADAPHGETGSPPRVGARSTHVIRDLLMCVVAVDLLFAVGCTKQTDSSDLTVRSKIEKPQSKETLTAAERDRRYRRVFNEGVRLVQGNQTGPALAAFQEAVRLKPNSTDALFNLGACFEELGDPMRAVHLYRRVLTITPDDPACYFNLGTSYIKMYYRDKSPGWRKMAREAWRQSLALRPGQVEVERFLARTETLD